MAETAFWTGAEAEKEAAAREGLAVGVAARPTANATAAPATSSKSAPTATTPGRRRPGHRTARALIT
jgi:hypothetical protein